LARSSPAWRLTGACCTACEQWKNDEAGLIRDHEEKLKKLQDEKAHGDEEYKKLLDEVKVQRQCGLSYSTG